MLHRVLPGVLNPKGFQTIADLSSAVGLTVPAGADYAVIQAETADVRWRDDGTNPTGTVGMLLDVSGQPEGFFYNGDLSAIKFIDDGGTTASLNVSYYALSGN